MQLNQCMPNNISLTTEKKGLKWKCRRILSRAQHVPKCLLGSRQKNLGTDLNKSGLEKRQVVSVGGEGGLVGRGSG